MKLAAFAGRSWIVLVYPDLLCSMKKRMVINPVCIQCCLLQVYAEYAVGASKLERSIAHNCSLSVNTSALCWNF